MPEPADILFLILQSSTGPIPGRTALQKIGYFSSVKLGLNLGYKPNFYGPHSTIIDENLMDLVSSDYIDEETRITVRDRTMYTYRLTDDGHQIAEQTKKQDPSLFKNIKKIVDQCADVGYNINILSWAAKVHYLITQKWTQMTYDEVIETGRALNWKLSEEDIQRGVTLLSRLGLVSNTS